MVASTCRRGHLSRLGLPAGAGGEWGARDPNTGCARRSPAEASKDAGSIPATSTPHYTVKVLLRAPLRRGSHRARTLYRTAGGQRNHIKERRSTGKPGRSPVKVGHGKSVDLIGVSDRRDSVVSLLYAPSALTHPGVVSEVEASHEGRSFGVELSHGSVLAPLAREKPAEQEGHLRMFLDPPARG